MLQNKIRLCEEFGSSGCCRKPENIIHTAGMVRPASIYGLPWEELRKAKRIKKHQGKF